MDSQHLRSVMTIALMAAFADEHKDEREREHLREMAESLGAGSGIDLMKLYQDVLLQRVKLEDATAALTTAPLRQLAFEMAVGVCDADGVCNEREKAFLQRLATALDVPAPEAATSCARPTRWPMRRCAPSRRRPKHGPVRRPRCRWPRGPVRRPVRRPRLHR